MSSSGLPGRICSQNCNPVSTVAPPPPGWAGTIRGTDLRKQAWGGISTGLVITGDACGEAVPASSILERRGSWRASARSSLPLSVPG